MRMKVLSAMLLAATVAACADQAPPPAPPAPPPPPPPPAPMAMGPVDGTYRGTAELAADAPRGCARMTRPTTVRVRNNTFALGGMRATIGPDGSITAPTRRGMSVSGNASGNGMTVMTMRGRCSYTYSFSKVM